LSGLIIVLTSFLNADSCYLLGGNNSNSSGVIKIKNSIFWFYKDGRWIVSPPQESIDLSKLECNSRDYILINDEMISYTTPSYDKEFYSIKKGWNYFTTPKDGVDVTKTFLDAEFVYVYDKRSRAWAGYSPKDTLMKKIKQTRILELKYIEPNRGFYVLSSKAMRVAISSKVANEQCQKIMKNKNYDIIYDSGIDKAFSYNGIKSVALASRYFSHNRKNIYNDSRIIIIVPKLKKLSTNKTPKKYGPAIPKMMIHFNEAYQEQQFYAYDFLNESCHMGYFPSKRKPPAPTMKKLK